MITSEWIYFISIIEWSTGASIILLPSVLTYSGKRWFKLKSFSWTSDGILYSPRSPFIIRILISSLYLIDFTSNSTFRKNSFCFNFFQSCSLFTILEPFLTNLKLLVSKAGFIARFFYGVGGLVSWTVFNYTEFLNL